MNVTGIQAVAQTGDEKVRGHCTPFPMLPTLGDVLGKYCAGRPMQWDKAVLPELGASNRQDRSLQIDVLQLEITMLLPVAVP